MGGRQARRVLAALGLGLTGLDAVAEALYAGDPAAFVAARDAAAKQARAAGDRELAASIKALRRPSVAAWYVNLAARASLVSLREWLSLGADLRAAQSTLDTARVRELSAGRTALENRVVRDLSAHLTALGVTVSAPALEEVRATLRAALAGQQAADAVAAGRLDRALTYGGFGEVDLSEALAAMAAAGPPRSDEGASKGSAEDDGGPRGALPLAPQSPPPPDPALVAALDEARARLDRDTEQAEEAEQATARAEAALAVAQRELREARAAQAGAERARTASEKAVRRAEEALEGP